MQFEIGFTDIKGQITGLSFVDALQGGEDIAGALRDDGAQGPRVHLVALFDQKRVDPRRGVFKTSVEDRLLREAKACWACRFGTSEGAAIFKEISSADTVPVHPWLPGAAPAIASRARIAYVPGARALVAPDLKRQSPPATISLFKVAEALSGPAKGCA